MLELAARYRQVKFCSSAYALLNGGTESMTGATTTKRAALPYAAATFLHRSHGRHSTRSLLWARTRVAATLRQKTPRQVSFTTNMQSKTADESAIHTDGKWTCQGTPE